MKKLFISTLMLLMFMLQAKAKPGIDFVKGMSWAQIKEKAKQEHKFIFLDIYTTWCVPCKLMANNIFPQAKVGDFFNQHFISVKVQFDETKHDNSEVKRWYADLKTIKEIYKIDLFPTYLFFNPEGELVHVIMGASPTAADFVTKAKKALTPSTQYITIKKAYINSNRDTGFLSKLVPMAQEVDDEQFLYEIAPPYLKMQHNMLTSQNLKLIATTTMSESDPGFKVLMDHGDKIDAAMGEKVSHELVTSIIFDTDVLPLLRENGKKQTFPGGLVMYSGKVIKMPDWMVIKEKLAAAYPNRAEEIILYAKSIYKQWK